MKGGLSPLRGGTVYARALPQNLGINVGAPTRKGYDKKDAADCSSTASSESRRFDGLIRTVRALRHAWAVIPFY